MKNTLLIILVILVVTFSSACVHDNLSTNFLDDDTIVIDSDKLGLNEDFTVSEIDGKYYTNFDFNGMYTIWEFDSESDHELNFDYEINLEFGEIRLVMIDPNNNVTDLLDEYINPETLGNKSINITKGNYRIKLLGIENAKGKIITKVNYGSISGVERKEKSNE